MGFSKCLGYSRRLDVGLLERLGNVWAYVTTQERFVLKLLKLRGLDCATNLSEEPKHSATEFTGI
jgi:hypothetical protein